MTGLKLGNLGNLGNEFPRFPRFPRNGPGHVFVIFMSF